MITELKLYQFQILAVRGKDAPGAHHRCLAPNSSGKSSILQLLLMLKQTIESTDGRKCWSWR